MRRRRKGEIGKTALIALVLLCLSLVLLRALRARAPEPTPEAAPAPTQETARTPPGGDDALCLRVWTRGELLSVSAADYLPGVLAGEMPASFSDAALRAQAVAARTYILWKTGHGCAAHPEADVCDEPSCCKAWCGEEELREKWGGDYEANMARMRAAVADTDGWYLSWAGEPIQAVFHAASPGRTEDSANIWQPLPYLVSVESPETAEEVPNYVTEVEVSAETLRETISRARPAADLSGSPEGWIGGVSMSDTGRVAYITLGGAAFTGQEIRQLFGLRSACFTLERTEAGFLFRVTGFGHGVGMSQYGAEVMARGGSTWQEILAHYYPGTTLESLNNDCRSALESAEHFCCAKDDQISFEGGPCPLELPRCSVVSLRLCF